MDISFTYIDKQILHHLYVNNGSYFNELCKFMKNKYNMSARNVYSSIITLEDSGIIKSSLERLQYNKTNIKRWVKKYRIVNKNELSSFG